jgi:hypothetical protein
MSHDANATADTPGGQPPEPVEDRPNVGTATPDDYPKKDRAGTVSDTELDEEKEYERLYPGSGGKTPAVPGTGHDRDNA